MPQTNKKYLKIYYKLRDDIVSGAYQAGSRLPSKRTIALNTGTSVITVEHALSLLEEEGYIECRERSGCYVIYREGELLSGREQNSDHTDSSYTQNDFNGTWPIAGNGQNNPASDAIMTTVMQDTSHDADQNAGITSQQSSAAKRRNPVKTGTSEHEASPLENIESAVKELFPFSTYAKTIRRVLATQSRHILAKSPHEGIPELRRAIAAYLARSRGISVSPDQIYIGSGSEYMYSQIVQMLGRRTIYGIEKPSYQKIRQVYEASGAAIDELTLDASGIRPEELCRTRAGVLHVTPYHSYPTGITASPSRRAAYIRWARERGAMIIEDDMDSEFTLSMKPEDTIFSLAPERVIYLNTFTRTIAPSVRIGYMVLPAGRRGELASHVAFCSCTVPVLDQYILAEFIDSGEFERHINRVRRRLRMGK